MTLKKNFFVFFQYFLVPIQAPQNIEKNVISSTSVQISFDPPNQQMVPGVNLGYKVFVFLYLLPCILL